jgi:coniferyl-aldehyde dehydrogenase
MTALAIVASDTAPSARELARSALERLRQGFTHEPYPSAAAREDRLERLERLLQRNVEAILEATAADFRGRSRVESLVADVHLPLEAIRHAKKHLRARMKPRPVDASWMFRPSSARIELQPKGVIGVLSPWNYPVNLALVPMAEALAAGNRVLLKPSEMAPRTAALLARLITDSFAADEVQVLLGGVEMAQAVTALPLDHLVFTGSTRVGREVARAAAENLVPTTLELGGKSPVIIHAEADLEHAVERIAAGKLFNAGQTCIAPDYVLLPEGKTDAFVQAFKGFVARAYGDLATSPDYTAILSDTHRDRLEHMLASAARHGANVVRVDPQGTLSARQPRMAPALVLNPPLDSHLMTDELFGPVLPIVTVRSVDDAVAFVNARPRPLALYLFDPDEKRAQQVLRRTHSGGATLNDTMLHFAQPGLPFGGVGASGHGAYHGEEGFLSFSHAKSVLATSPLSGVRMFHPPYPALVEKAVRMFIAR